MKHTVRVITHWALLAHIYVSMAGFTLALLFGITGLTLNHQNFGFSDPRISTSEIHLDKDLVDNPDQARLDIRKEDRFDHQLRAAPVRHERPNRTALLRPADRTALVGPADRTGHRWMAFT